jgi:hypothetical protein
MPNEPAVPTRYLPTPEWVDLPIAVLEHDASLAQSELEDAELAYNTAVAILDRRRDEANRLFSRVAYARDRNANLGR